MKKTATQTRFNFGHLRDAVEQFQADNRGAKPLARLVAEPVTFRFVAQPAAAARSASWFFEPYPRPGRHFIYIGRDLGALGTLKPGASVSEFGAACCQHEMAHAVFTERDLPGLEFWCQTQRVPFSLLNLLEDIRVEHCWRTALGRQFDWQKFETLETPDTPVKALRWLLQREGAPALNAALRDHAFTRRVVRDYYPAIIACRDTGGLKRLALDWCGEFGIEQSALPFASDFVNALSLQRSRRYHDSIEAGSCLLAELNGKSATGARGRADYIAQLNDGWSTESREGSLLAEVAQPSPDRDPLRIATDICRAAFDRDKVFRVVDAGATRAVPAGSLRARPRLYRSAANAQTQGGQGPRVIAFIDTSRAMTGEPQAGAILLASLLNSLAREHTIQARIVLHGGRRRRDGGTFQVLSLPQPGFVCEHIPADGAQSGLARALSSNEAAIRESDQVLVYGLGIDADQSLEGRTWRGKGASVIGLCCGAPDAAKTLRQCTDIAICRDTPLAMIEALSLLLTASRR